MLVLVVLLVAAWFALPRFDDLMGPTPDASAKALARNLASQVETCFGDTHDYRRCGPTGIPANSGIAFGNDPNEATVWAHTARTYTIAAHSTSGNTFYITKINDRTISRWCEPGHDGQGEGETKGSCPVAREW